MEDVQIQTTDTPCCYGIKSSLGWFVETLVVSLAHHQHTKYNIDHRSTQLNSEKEIEKLKYDYNVIQTEIDLSYNQNLTTNQFFIQ